MYFVLNCLQHLFRAYLVSTHAHLQSIMHTHIVSDDTYTHDGDVGDTDVAVCALIGQEQNARASQSAKQLPLSIPGLHAITRHGKELILVLILHGTTCLETGLLLSRLLRPVLSVSYTYAFSGMEETVLFETGANLPSILSQASLRACAVIPKRA